MEFLEEWIRSIIIFILLATVINMILPNSSMQKYVKMVSGFILTVIIINPLFQLLQTDVSEILSTFDEKLYPSIENTINEKKNEIQANQRAYILEQTAVQLAEEVKEELGETYHLQINHIDLSADENLTVEKVQVTVAETDNLVKEVKINTRKEENRQLTEIQTFLAEKWQMPKEQIVVSEEGG